MAANLALHIEAITEQQNGLEEACRAEQQKRRQLQVVIHSLYGSLRYGHRHHDRLSNGSRTHDFKLGTFQSKQPHCLTVYNTRLAGNWLIIVKTCARWSRQVRLEDLDTDHGSTTERRRAASVAIGQLESQIQGFETVLQMRAQRKAVENSKVQSLEVC